jgi:hypothetical protein
MSSAIGLYAPVHPFPDETKRCAILAPAHARGRTSKCSASDCDSAEEVEMAKRVCPRCAWLTLRNAATPSSLSALKSPSTTTPASSTMGSSSVTDATCQPRPPAAVEVTI